MSVNWIDIGLLVLLGSMIYVGSKKGLVRELMAFFFFVTGIVLAIRYIDAFALWVGDHMKTDTLMSATLAFVFLMAIAYGLFKALGLVFYKIGSLNNLGQKDKIAGAVVGAVRGWLAMSLALFLGFLAPVPERFHTEMRSSLLGAAVVRTLPLIYETTSPMHPADTNFMAKMEETLLRPVDGDNIDDEKRADLTESRQDAYRTIFRLDSVMTK